MQTVTGISKPPCMRGDRQYLESTTVTLTFPPLEIRKRVYLEISLGKCPTIESDKVVLLLLSHNDHDRCFFHGYSARFLQLLVSRYLDTREILVNHTGRWF